MSVSNLPAWGHKALPKREEKKLRAFISLLEGMLVAPHKQIAHQSRSEVPTFINMPYIRPIHTWYVTTLPYGEAP